MATLQTENGPKTPEQMAKDIIDAANESKMVEISGTCFQRLETVVRYLNREKIAARGDNWFKKNYDSLVTDTVETLVTAREKAINDYMDKKEQSAKDDLFRLLMAKGTAIEVAYKDAYGVAYAPKVEEKKPVEAVKK